MNLALPTLIVFIVLLPGFIFRSGLKRVERISIDFSPFGRVATEGVIWAILLHLIWLMLSYFLFSRKFDPVVFLNILSSVPASQSKASLEAGSEFSWISTYFISLLLISFVLPAVIRSAISKFRLDRDGTLFSSIFRFHDAPWYYLLTGADFEVDSQPDLIKVSAIVEVAKEAVLYVGVLNDFYFDADGQLDRLILQNVSRRPVSSDKLLDSIQGPQIEERFYPIDGDNFVLRYGEAITLNIQYIKLTESPINSDV